MARKTQNEITPASLLQQAIELKADPEQLGKLMELQIRWEDRKAQKEYVEAMAKFRSQCPAIIKTKKGHNSYYAPLNQITYIVKDLEKECGLTHAWLTKNTDKGIMVTCRVTHIGGHYEETSMIGMPDKTGSKNDIQAIGSTVSYLERYTLCALFGVATQDMDDDGGNGKEPKSKNMLIEQVIKDAYAEYSKSHKITEDRFKTELKNVYTDLSPEEREGFNWNEKGVKFLLSKFVSNDTKSTKKVAQAANTEPQSATEQLRELF